VHLLEWRMTQLAEFPSIKDTKQVRILKTQYTKIKRLGKRQRRTVPGQLQFILGHALEVGDGKVEGLA